MNERISEESIRLEKGLLEDEKQRLSDEIFQHDWRANGDLQNQLLRVEGALSYAQRLLGEPESLVGTIVAEKMHEIERMKARIGKLEGGQKDVVTE